MTLQRLDPVALATLSDAPPERFQTAQDAGAGCHAVHVTRARLTEEAGSPQALRPETPVGSNQPEQGLPHFRKTTME